MAILQSCKRHHVSSRSQDHFLSTGRRLKEKFLYGGVHFVLNKSMLQKRQGQKKSRGHLTRELSGTLRELSETL